MFALYVKHRDTHGNRCGGFGLLGSIRLLLSMAALALALPPGAGAATTVTSFQAGNGNWHLGTLSVGNIDNDPELEIVIPFRGSNSQWQVDAFNHDGTRIAGFPYNTGGAVANLSPTLVDVDADGRQEILFTAGDRIIALNGENGSVLWQSNRVQYTNYIPDAGYQVVPGKFYWSSNGAQIATLPSTAAFYSEVSPPIVADIDGDGTFEVLTAWKIDPDTTSTNQDFNPFINDIYGSGEWGTVGDVWSGGVIVSDARTGAREFTYHIHQIVEAGLALGQADDDDPLEVYVLNDSDSVVCFDLTKPHGFYGKGMLHKQFGKNQRLISGSYQLGVDIYASDIDGDGRDEVLVPTREVDPLWQPHETILDDDGTILWRQWKTAISYTHSFGWQNSACMIPCNPDRDNHADVLTYSDSFKIYFRYWNGVELVDHPGWPKNFSPQLPTPPVVGDVDGDGQEEILIGTYTPSTNPPSGNLYVYNLDGSLQETVPVPGGLKHIPFLSDVNKDGTLDVIYRSMSGLVTVLNFGPGDPNRVSWASHRGNAAHNGQLTVPLYPPGTPLITSKTAGYRKATLVWETPDGPAQGFTLRRATAPQGPFTDVAYLPGTTFTYTDAGLETGRIYFYEVQASYATGPVRSPPVNVVPLYSSNLIANGGFEENNDSHWDKWYTGSIPWQNMHASTTAYQGDKSMQIDLQNHGSNSSIKQFNQYGIPDSSIPVTPGKFYSYGGFFRSGGLSQNSQHWFEWNSAKTGTDTNNRPSLPSPNYFTPRWSIGASPTGWSYANRVFTMPAGFPNVELRHRFTVAGPATGPFNIDNVFFRELPAPNSAAWETWIPLRSTWKFFNVAGGAVPPANWYTVAFNDTAWPLGTAKFGAGGGPTGVVTPLPIKQPKYYFRKQFTVNGASYQDLLLEATCTDDYAGTVYPLEIYLNGTRLETTGIACVTGTGNTVLYYDLTPFLPLITQGVNTIGVVVNNTWQSTWDNVAFDIGLKAIPDGTAPPPPPPGPPTVTIAATDSSAVEGGSDNGTFTVTRTGSTSGTLAVNYTIGGSASNGTDYTVLSGTVTIPSGSNTAPITVSALTDASTEGAETVVLTLSANAAYQIGTPDNAAVNITDPPPPTAPTVTVSASDASASETGPNTGTFTVSRTGSTASALVVLYSMSGTASNGTDYTILNGSVTIPSGSSSAPVIVTPSSDGLTEGTETAILTLSANAAYQIGAGANATVSIADASSLPVVTLILSDAIASEVNADQGLYTVQRTGSTATSMVVNYTLSGTATNGVDYNSKPGFITIPAGSASTIIKITPIDDTLVEGVETVIMTLSNGAGYQIGTPNTGTVTIAGE